MLARIQRSIELDESLSTLVRHRIVHALATVIHQLRNAAARQSSKTKAKQP